MGQDLVPQVNLSDFKKMKAIDIKEMKSVEVISDGETLFFAIIPPANGGASVTDNIKTQATYLGVLSNTVGGKNPNASI
jgi:hypothetical protein